MRRLYKWITVLGILLAIPLAYGLYVSRIGIGQSQAEEEFYNAWLLYQDRAYDASIEGLSKALKINAHFHAARRLLANAFYQSGQFSEAIEEFAILAEELPQDLTVRNRIESLNRSAPEATNLTEKQLQFLRVLPRMQGFRYNKPTFLKSMSDNRFVILSLGNLEIGSMVALNPQGEPVDNRHRISGKLEYPMGLAATEQEVWITDFKEDKIHRYKKDQNRWLAYFSSLAPVGKNGDGELQFRGPAGICYRNGEFIVADSGNNRLQRISPEGKFISYIDRGDEADPLQTPFGLVCDETSIWVTESGAGRISIFDRYGNLLSDRSPKELKKPRHIERIEATGDYLVADEVSGVLQYSSEGNLKKQIRDYVDSEGNRKNFARVYSAAFDAFHNLFVADYGSSEVVQFIPESDLFNHLSLQVEKVNSARFPSVGIYVTVQDSTGRYLTDLTDGDFRVFENDVDTGNLATTYLQQFQQILNTIIIVPRDKTVATYENQVPWIFDHLFTKIREKDRLKVISYGTDVRQETGFINSRLKLLQSIRGALSSGTNDTDQKLSEAMYDGLQQLVNAEGRKALVLFTKGSQTEEDFTFYGKERIEQFAKANHIPIYVFNLEHESNEGKILLQEICRATGGEYFPALKINSDVDKRLRSNNEVRYVLSYSSLFNKEMKGQYIDLRATVKFRNQRGMDFSGYFIPK